MKVKKITELNRLSVEGFKSAEKIPLVVVLDDIRSLNNVGSVFRTSDAFLVEKIILCGITATPPHPDIHKTALGAEYSVEWEYFQDIKETILLLREKGYILYATEQAEGSVMLDELKLEKGNRYAVVLGNEVRGVKQEVVDICDYCVEIPQYGTKHSLNVSVAAGLIIWDFSKQLK